MSRKASPAFIGAFIVGAVILAVVGVLIFGSGKFLKERLPVVMYFEGTLSGLNIGAPVVFRGVEVGTVTDITIEYHTKEMSIRIPVFAEIEPDRIKMIGNESQNIDTVHDLGMKAQLQMQSMITGQLMVALDFYPDQEIKLYGAPEGFDEIPTIQTTLQKLSKTYEELPIKELIHKILAAVDGIEKIVSSPEIPKTMQSMQMVMKDIRKLVNNVDEKIVPLSTNLEQTTIAARKVMEQTDKTLILVEDILAEDSAPRSKISKALEEFADAARSMRLLADYLERHPEALLRGKKGNKKER